MKSKNSKLLDRALVERTRYVIINNHLDVDDLVLMLEITPEDLLERFEDRLEEHADKFVPDGYMVTEDDYKEDHLLEEENEEELEEQ